VPRGRATGHEQPGLFEVKVSTAPAVPAIRKGVADWRADAYKGATPTSRLLLNYWFRTDHRLRNGSRFQYYESQREALETLIYVYEVARTRRHRDLLERFAPNIPGIHVLQYDEFPRYCVKMATGSGKTKVIALAMAWHYFNAVAEGRDDYAQTFLLLAPNVIVFERLRSDFAAGRIFRTDPIVPPELEVFWDFECYMRGEPEHASSLGALYLTNIQQFYRSEGSNGVEPEEMVGVLGPKPPTGRDDQSRDLDARIAGRGGPCVILNDEGHHTHDEDKRMEQGDPPLVFRGLGRAGWATRFHSHSALQQRGPLHLDDFRLPAQAGDHRQRRQAAYEGDDGRDRRAAL